MAAMAKNTAITNMASRVGSRRMQALLPAAVPQHVAIIMDGNHHHLISFPIIYLKAIMKISSLAAVIVLGLTGTTTFAEEANTGWYLAPTAGITLNDSVRTKNTGGAVGLAIGKVLNEKWSVELGGQYLRLAGKPDEQGNIGVDGLYFFNRNPDFAPYAVAGLGYAREERASGNTPANDNLLVKAGLGFTKKMSRNVDFRTDARYQWHTNKNGVAHHLGNNLGDWVISAGLNIYFGD